MNAPVGIELRRPGLRAVMTHVVVVVSCTLLVASVQADTDPATVAAPPFTASGGGEAVGLLQLTGSLLLVLAVVFAVAWALRRLQLPGRIDSRHLQILAQLPLGARERAVLIQVGDKHLLLGVAAGSVTTLHVLDTPVSMPDTGEHTVDFKAVLLRSLGRA